MKKTTRDGAVCEGREARHRSPAGRHLVAGGNGMKNPNDAGAGASDYLRLMGITCWSAGCGRKMAKVSQAKLAAKDDAASTKTS